MSHNSTPMTLIPADNAGTTSTGDRLAVIAGIRELNRTAAPTFLAQFNTEALADYLEHLREARNKNVRLTGWLHKRTAKKRTGTMTFRKAG